MPHQSFLCVAVGRLSKQCYIKDSHAFSGERKGSEVHGVGVLPDQVLGKTVFNYG